MINFDKLPQAVEVASSKGMTAKEKGREGRGGGKGTAEATVVRDCVWVY